MLYEADGERTLLHSQGKRKQDLGAEGGFLSTRGSSPILNMFRS